MIKIGKNKIGGNYPCYIVGEIGINFDGKFDQAIELINAAADAGCNAVKFQLFKAETMYAKNAGKYKISTGEKQDITEIVKNAELPYEWIKSLKKYASSKKLDFFSSVFDEKNAEELEDNNVVAFKIASYEVTHLPLIKHVAKFNKPVIISSGGSNLDEVIEAIRAIKSQGNKKIVLMHCMAMYPIPLFKTNLKIISTLRLVFPDLIIGYSDHTSEPFDAPVTAVSLGAKVIEKHITIDRKLSGPDHSFALNPGELKEMVKKIRETERKLKNGNSIPLNKRILGSSERKTYPEEEYVRKFTYRGIFSTKSIRKGERFTRKSLAVLRPGINSNGLHPRFYELILSGCKATRDIPEGKGIKWEDLLVRN